MCDLSNPIFKNEDKARTHLEQIRWPDGPVCPFCGQLDSVKKLGGKSMGKGWYHCKDCREKFTVRVGSVFERSKIPLTKWMMAFHLMAASKKGISAHQLHRMLGLSYKSAWFMAHRIRECMKPGTGGGPFGGPGKHVEVDETYHGAPKRRYKTKYVSGKGWKASKGPLLEKIKIMTLVERGGRARSFTMTDVTTKSVSRVLFRNIDRDSILNTDEAGWYKKPGREFAKHQSVNHKAEEYARGDATTNSIEGFFSIFKCGMRGVYQHCGEQHLKRYLCEFDFRYSHRRISDAARAVEAIKGAEGRRLTYQQTNRAA